MTGFGAFLSSNHPPERQWDLARRVDALGFDSIWTGDHVSFHLPRYDSMALLASYASTTAHLTFITLDRDRDRARRRWVSRLSARYAQDFGPLADRYGVIGTADECLEQIERFRAAGCGYFLLNPICEPEEEGEQLEGIASELLPRLGT